MDGDRYVEMTLKESFFIEKSQAQYNIPHAQYGRTPLGIKIVEPESMGKVRRKLLY